MVWDKRILQPSLLQSRNNIFHCIWASFALTALMWIDHRVMKNVFSSRQDRQPESQHLMAGWIIKTAQRMPYLDTSTQAHQKQGRGPQRQKWFISFDRIVHSVIYCIFSLILSNSYNGMLWITCAIKISCNWKKSSDSTSMLASISVLWIVINNSEITTVAQKNCSFLLSLSDEDDRCKTSLVSVSFKKFAAFLAGRMCFPLYF